MKVYLLGFMGAGKTYWGKQLHQSLGMPVFDLDKEIVRREGATIQEIFSHRGEAHFRMLEHKYLKQLTEEKEEVIISCGGGTPCFSGNMSLMNKNGITVWLNVPVDVMVNRLKRGRNKRPLLTGMSEEQLHDFVQKKLEERTSFYEQAQLNINPIKHSVDSLTKKIQLCENPI